MKFHMLSDFSEENIKTWSISYVNFNNDISAIIYQGREDLSFIKKVLFDMKVKQDITLLPLGITTFNGWISR